MTLQRGQKKKIDHYRCRSAATVAWTSTDGTSTDGTSTDGNFVDVDAHKSTIHINTIDIVYVVLAPALLLYDCTMHFELYLSLIL